LEEFNREIKLLTNNLNNNKEKLFVYISSCSIDDKTMSNSKYVKHKFNAENIIKKLSKNFIIFRTSNPI
jgi:dTDP-4-dehydrorhamnose reductase